MTKNDIKERIERLKDLRFELNMKDRWNREDYRRWDCWGDELRQLEKELEKEEG